MSLASLRRVRVEIQLRQSLTLGVCFRGLRWLEQYTPHELEFWTMERYAICALLGLPLLILNELACCLSLRIHAAIVLFTGGFGRVWGDSEALHRQAMHSARLRTIEFACHAAQALPMRALLLDRMAVSSPRCPR